jgi:hypothetical protein
MYRARSILVFYCFSTVSVEQSRVSHLKTVHPWDGSTEFAHVGIKPSKKRAGANCPRATTRERRLQPPLPGMNCGIDRILGYVSCYSDHPIINEKEADKLFKGVGYECVAAYFQSKQSK